MKEQVIKGLMDYGIKLYDIDHNDDYLYILMSDLSDELIDDYCTMYGENCFAIHLSSLNKKYYYKLDWSILL